MDTVMGLGTGNPVVVFSKANCCLTHTINVLIRGYGANPVVYELDKLPNGRQIEMALIAMGSNPSVPAVFIGKEYVGGSNEIMSLKIQGKLRELLINAKAIWV